MNVLDVPVLGTFNRYIAYKIFETGSIRNGQAITKCFLVIISFFFASQAIAVQDRFFIGFGEIPIFADSFKPSLGYSRKLDEFQFGLYVQFEDDLNRDDESFNADFGQDGLVSSRETTGNRAMLQSRYFPLENNFYISLGVFFGGRDSEKMEFDSRPRSIGSNSYNSSITVELDRRKSIEPTIGIGVTVPVTDKWSFTSDFTMAWIGTVPEPDLKISTSANISQSDFSKLENQIRDNYESNFHNRYHFFNVGMEYRF